MMKKAVAGEIALALALVLAVCNSNTASRRVSIPATTSQPASMSESSSSEAS